MAYRQYTKCYNYTPGDQPFNESNMVLFVLGNSAPGLLVALAAFLTGADVVGFVAIALQYAATITAVANEWLYHRLVCISGDQCAVGTVEFQPEIGSLLGAFDNDQFFDLRVMPHRPGDLYKGWDGAYFNSIPTPTNPSPSPPGPGPSMDGLTEHAPANDVYLDNFQGTALIQPANYPALPYDAATTDDPEVPSGTKVSRATLHVEAEGNFWQAMLDTAALQGVAVGGGAAAGAALGCGIGSIFGPIGCLIGAILGAIAGALGGAYVAASAAFNSDPGSVDDTNVGDSPLGPLQHGDRVAVYGTHVYDGFHEGWLEIHPLKAITRVNDPDQYPEWDPNFPAGGTSLPAGLTAADMAIGLESPAFRATAVAYRNRWCGLLSERFAPPTQDAQSQPQNQWTIHPAVDGCTPQPPGGGPPPHVIP